MQNADDIAFKSPHIFEKYNKCAAECAYFAHVFEEYDDFAVHQVGLAVWLAETQHAV